MRSAAIAVVVLALLWPCARADEGPWRGATTSTPSATSDSFPVTLGRPIPIQTSATQAPGTNTAVSTAVPTSFWGDPPAIVRAQMADSPPPPPPPPPGAASAVPPFPGAAPGGEEAYNCGVVAPAAAGAATGSSVGGFFEKCWGNTKKFFTDAPSTIGGVFQGRAMFQSDHKFDNFISPVTNPFLFEDPRALTELRPIIMWQQTPSQNPVFHGGDNFFVGTQARVAFTDWFSLVINRFGGVWMETSSPFGSHDGFSEFWLGPKFTFIRNDRTGTLLAGGATFEIPTGPGKVFQNTGTLGIAPYLSFGQNFLKSFPYGSFNFLNTTGYSFSTDNSRSEYFYSSFHLDYDIGNLHRIYPLIEMNWYHYARNGHPQTLGFEGADLFNFGSNNAGHDDFNVAFGGRYVLNKNIQFGTGLQWGLLSPSHHLEGFRLTMDMIIRY